MKLRTFRGGVHPPDRKELSKECEIQVFDAPELVSIPVAQHIGAPSSPVVAVGDQVKMGQVIADSSGFVSVPQHSSVSGTVKKIEPRPHIFGNTAVNIIIENDGQDDKVEGWGQEARLEDLDTKTIKSRIHDAGIVGMGGATFPTHVKISPPPDFKIDSIILNGAECEPYLTCDYRLMLSQGEAILRGLEILMKVLDCKAGYVGIESNKPDVIEHFRKINSNPAIKVEGLQVKYPQGAEKQLIKAILDRDVPAGGLPMAVNALVQNMGTAYAIHNAVLFGIPLVERLVTVTGEGIEKPGNFQVRVGTPIQALLDHCQMKASANKVILGGPMMGLAQKTADLPVIKGTSGVLILENQKAFKSGPCIHCGRCIGACPMNLVPAELSIAAESQSEELYEYLHALDCIECGCCSYGCPSKRPIVHQIKLAKAVIMGQRAESRAKAEADEKAAAEQKEAEAAASKPEAEDLKATEANEEKEAE